LLRRIFIIKSPTAITSPNFPLKGIAGATGRLDVICRSIIATFKLKPPRIRRNTIFYGILSGPPQPPISIVVDGSKLSSLPVNEVEVARIIKDLLLSYWNKTVHKYSGWSIYKWDLRRVLDNVRKQWKTMLVYLREGGAGIQSVIKGLTKSDYEVIAFVLGSHVDLDVKDEKLLEDYGAVKVSIGPQSYLSSHVITYVHFILDLLSV